MTEFDRRTIIGGAALAGTALAGAALTSTAIAAAPAITPIKDIKKEADVACIYHCDFGDAARFAQMLNNISNHYAVYGNPLDIQISVVVHAAGLKFFLESLDSTIWKDQPVDPQLFKRVTDLTKSGLTVYLCNITFERQKIDRELAKKADFIKFVPSGVATLAALQSKGFAYIKVG